MTKAEQFIKNCTRGCSNELCAVEDRYGKKVISYHEWLTPEQALSAIQIAKEEWLDKACEWLKSQYKEHYHEALVEDLLKHFHNAMEE